MQAVRSVKGGYSLAVSPTEMTVLLILEALEEPLALSECPGGSGCCGKPDTSATSIRNVRNISIDSMECLAMPLGEPVFRLVMPGFEANPAKQRLPGKTKRPAFTGRWLMMRPGLLLGHQSDLARSVTLFRRKVLSLPHGWLVAGA